MNTGIQDTLAAPAHAALWGIGRAAALERPDRWGGLVDLPPTIDSRIIQHLLAVLRRGYRDDQLAIRRSGVFGRRLVRKPAPESVAACWQPRGTVLVTGGAEGLGRQASIWLARAGAERLIITTDETSATSVDDLRHELAELGTATTVAACLESDRNEIARLICETPGSPPLTAVVHAADRTCTGAIDDTDPAGLADMFAAKVDIALWLDDLLAEAPLDAFVVFSSIAGVWGGGGQAVSGAANAVLDALVEWRRGRGLAATSIAWGALDRIGGMDADTLAQLRRRGVLPMTTHTAMAAFEQAAVAGEKFATVADMDWDAFISAFTSVRASSLFADLPEAQAALRAAQPDTDNDDAVSSLVDSLRAVGDTEQNHILLRLVCRHAAAVLGHSSSESIGPSQAFQNVGFDSLAAVNLRNSLHVATGLRLPATLIFDYPTPEALVGYLRAELLRDTGDDLDGIEAELRRALATVSLARLREARVLDTLLALVDTGAASAPAAQAATAGDDLDLIDAMDVAGLVRRALDTTN